MPFVCHSKLLLKYLPDHEDNLNPILRKMISDGVVFYGTPSINRSGTNKHQQIRRLSLC